MAPPDPLPSPPTSTASGEIAYRTPSATPSPDSAPQSPPTYPTPSPSSTASNEAAPLAAAQPAKRARRSNRKVKTGCSNCKHRRIKCDERRPSCSQCVRSKKICTGYPAPSRTFSAPLDIQIAPRPQLSDDSVSLQPRPAPPEEGLLSGAPSLLLRGHTVILPPRRAPRRRRPLNPLLASITKPTMYQPSSTLALQHTEGLYFELFRIQTASELSGYFNSTFWTQRVLQECHYEPAIRHAVIALGALYKTLEQSCEPDATPMAGAMSRLDSVMCHWQVAIRQYSEACNSIISLKEGSLATNRTLLMASVLLTCFDSFIGDHKQAIRQIQTGLGLLDRIQAEEAHFPAQIQQEHVEEDLLVIFTRLAIQAKSYDMAFHFPHPYVIQLGPQGRRDPSSPVTMKTSPSPGPSRIPRRFESLRDARLASDKLCEMLLRFIEHLQWAKTEPTYTLPTAWLQYAATFQNQLDAWSAAFQPIFESRMNISMPIIEKSGIAALKMFQINTNILFSMMFFNAEVQFDGYLSQFKEIVNLGWEVVGDDEKRASVTSACLKPEVCQQRHGFTMQPNGRYTAHHIRPSFSADLGIVPPLFVVATKCRDPATRRQAIQLLQSSARREGMWDSELSARIGEWIMWMEESDDAFPVVEELQTQPERSIPEYKRVMVQAVDFDLRARFAEIKVGSRDIHQGSEDRRKKATRIKW
ncbi:putative transcriptional regulatory protein C15D4.02 [Cladobotryum mycophilum]|uniref:Transcriptional regulatory protein C15D4.02 n=1 Tax=Cladobotryum mycophilum TaxID=491253 RepID=A0ABR0SMB7_9HYPO